MKLADEPLTQGPKALHEGVLLGRALLGHDASAVESRVLVNEAWEAARLPHRDVTVRVVLQRAGQKPTEMYISIDAAGGGRYHGQNRPPHDNINDLIITENSTPARNRFLSLHQHLVEQLREAQTIETMGGPPLHPVALGRWNFIHNVANTLSTGRPPDASNLQLAAMTQELKSSLLFVLPPVPGSVRKAAEQLESKAITLRRDGKLDSYATAALLLVAHLPLAIEEDNRSEIPEVELTRYFTFGVLEMAVSPWQAIYGPAHKALREKYRSVVLKVAQALLSAAEEYKDAALDGPADREYFSEQLFLAAPYAFAALQLFQFAREQQVDEEVQSYATRTEELFVRIQDGLTRQWLDLDDVRLQQEHQAILDAQSQGDTRTVKLLLREGEEKLGRPRSVRDLLLGKKPWPTMKKESEE